MRILPPLGSKAQRATWLLCLLVWCQPILVNYLLLAINKITNISFDVIYNYIQPSIYALLALFSISYIGRKIRTGDVLFCFGCLAVFLGSYFFVPSNREYLSTLLLVIPFVMLPTYMLGVSFEFEPLKKRFYYLSIISIVAQFLFFRTVTATGGAANLATSEADHYMHLSYQVLPYVLYVIWFAIEKLNWLNLTISIAGSLLILLFGTRGPFLSVVFFIVVYLIVYKLSHLGAFKKILILFGGVLLYVGFTSLVTQTMETVSSLGGSTRILGWLLGTDAGAAISSMERWNIAELAINELKNSGYMGLGFAGDRIFMNGYYVHNFILECLVSFGILFGILIPAIIFYRLAKGVLRNANSDKCKFLLVLIGLGMIPLLVSGSYVDEPWFYLMLGYCAQTLRTPLVKL